MIDKTPNAQGGIKFDNEKLLFDLLEPEFEEGIAKVLTYGAKKYAPDNWKKIETRRYYHALRRHWNAYRKGERFDEESGESHLYHMACCLMFIDWADRQKDKGLQGLFKVDVPVRTDSIVFTKTNKTPSIVRDFEIAEKEIHEKIKDNKNERKQKKKQLIEIIKRLSYNGNSFVYKSELQDTAFKEIKNMTWEQYSDFIQTFIDVNVICSPPGMEGKMWKINKSPLMEVSI